MESGGTLRNKWGVKAQELLKVGASEFIWGPCWKRTCGGRSVTQEDWNSERKMSRGALTRRRPKWEQGTNLDRWSRWAHGTRSIAPATNHSGGNGVWNARNSRGQSPKVNYSRWLSEKCAPYILSRSDRRSGFRGKRSQLYSKPSKLEVAKGEIRRL